ERYDILPDMRTKRRCGLEDGAWPGGSTADSSHPEMAHTSPPTRTDLICALQTGSLQSKSRPPDLRAVCPTGHPMQCWTRATLSAYGPCRHARTGKRSQGGVREHIASP